MQSSVTPAAEPCDYAAPNDGVQFSTHSHADGRRCVWDTDHWESVQTQEKTPNFEIVAEVGDLSQGQAPDQKATGLYPKYYVARADRRDQPGGDREGARQGYFVLDPVFDPIARPALALYAALAREHGYEKLAADLEHNLKVLGDMVYESQAGQEKSVRAVATWTYPIDPRNFGDEVRNALQAIEMEQDYLDTGDLKVLDLPGAEDASVRIMLHG